MSANYRLLLLSFAALVLGFEKTLAQQTHVLSQPTQTEHSYLKYPRKFVSAQVTTEEISDLLLKVLPGLQKNPSELALALDLSSPGGRHVVFQQTFDNIPVYGATLKVNLAKDGRLLNVLDNSKAIPANPVNVFSTDLSQIEKQVLEDSGGQLWRAASAYLCESGQLIAVFLIETFLENDGKGSRYFYNAETGALLRRESRSLNRTQEYRDGKGKIFAPDPLTTACVHYDQASLYHDNSDNNSTFFAQQYVEATLGSLHYERGTYQLKGPFVEIADIRPPSVLPAISYDGVFNYDRSVPAFEQVNTYYHIHTFKERVNALGFGGLADYPIRADAQGATADNSFFTPAGANSYLIFGTGGVDDAEDADVIIHEYGHALSASGSPNSLQGYERQALDEGICDFFAASWSRAFSECRWADIFTWDGHNVHWPGRTAQTSQTYNGGDLDRNRTYHEHGQLWSSAMMTLWEAVGRDVAERLQLQQLYMNNNNMTLRDAARALLDADVMLYEGAHFAEIQSAFCKYDLLPPDECGPASIEDETIFQSLGFKYYPSPVSNRLYIELESIDSESGIKVFDITGKLYYFSSLTSYKNDIDLSGFAPGVYVGEVFNSGNRVRFKFIKAGN